LTFPKILAGTQGAHFSLVNLVNLVVSIATQPMAANSITWGATKVSLGAGVDLGYGGLLELLLVHPKSSQRNTLIIYNSHQLQEF
jgi:hypothetical protein